jgi:hypothetical protein
VALGRATLATCALLLAVAAGAWIHVVLGMRAHGHEAMAGMSTMSLRDGIAYVASWVVMMAA